MGRVGTVKYSAGVRFVGIKHSNNSNPTRQVLISRPSIYHLHCVKR